MNRVHRLLCDLYPGFPVEPNGHLQVRVESGAEWLHIECDALGVSSPYRARAIRHLHASGQYWDGKRLCSAIILFSLVPAPKDPFRWAKITRDGIVNFDAAAWPSIWVPTAASASIEAGPLRHAWLDGKGGKIRSLADQAFCKALADRWDEAIRTRLLSRPAA